MRITYQTRNLVQISVGNGLKSAYMPLLEAIKAVETVLRIAATMDQPRTPMRNAAFETSKSADRARLRLLQEVAIAFLNKVSCRS